MMKHPFVVLAVCEIVYVVCVRFLLHRFTGSFIHLELYWSAIRVVSICVLVWLFTRATALRPASPARLSPRLLVATGMFLAPILIGNMGLPRPARYLFAATSVLVAVREELAYRGIFQAVLVRRFGLAAALIISNLGFVAYHIGVGPLTLHFFLQVFLCGTILGIVYHLSGSIVVVIALHAVYDAIDAFSPYLMPSLPDYVCTVILSTTLGALLLATRRRNQPALPPSQRGAQFANEALPPRG